MIRSTAFVHRSRSLGIVAGDFIIACWSGRNSSARRKRRAAGGSCRANRRPADTDLPQRLLLTTSSSANSEKHVSSSSTPGHRPGAPGDLEYRVARSTNHKHRARETVNTNSVVNPKSTLAVPGYEQHGRQHTFKVVLAYDGGAYRGWQILLNQPNNRAKPTVQGCLEAALTAVTGEDRTVLGVMGAGRTDAGVHAHAQVAHFYTAGPLMQGNMLLLQHEINSLLPPDIRCCQVARVPRDFHALRSSTSKVYHYEVEFGEGQEAASQARRCHLQQRFCIATVRRAAQDFVGTHNMTAFVTFTRPRRRAAREPNPVRTVHRVDIVETAHGMRFEVEGSGFGYQQVRNMVGVLIQIGYGRLAADCIPAMIASEERTNGTWPTSSNIWLDKSRPAFTITARAQGLYLASVEYPPHHDPAVLLHQCVDTIRTIRTTKNNPCS